VRLEPCSVREHVQVAGEKNDAMQRVIELEAEVADFERQAKKSAQ
jgi:hypothetical protein